MRCQVLLAIVHSAAVFLSVSAETNMLLTIGVVRSSSDVGKRWNKMKQYFRGHDIELSIKLYEDYDSQVKDLISGDIIDIAWNSPIAHEFATTLAGGEDNLASLGMRDSDRDFSSVVVARVDWVRTMKDNDASLGQPHVHKAIEKLARKGRFVAGARDSPQAYVVPMFYFNRDLGVKLKAKDIKTFDEDLGKHGDTLAGEMKVLDALANNKGDVGFVSEKTWLEYDGPGEIQTLALEHPIHFDHHKFDSIVRKLPEPDRARFTKALLAMDFGDEAERKIMSDMGVRNSWKEGRHAQDFIMSMALQDLQMDEKHIMKDKPKAKDSKAKDSKEEL